MVKVIATCFAFDHDPALVALAMAICLLACLTYVNMLARAGVASGNSQRAWIAGAAVAFGGGVWATHFIALIGFKTTLQPEFALEPTIVSFCIAIIGSGLASAVQMQRPPRVGQQAAWRLLAGLILGGSIAAMHFSGMLALRRAGFVVYDTHLVIAAVALGTVLSVAAMMVAAPRRRAAAVCLLVLAVFGLHFTGMAALHLLPWAPGDSAGGLVASASLAMATGAVALFILLLSLAGTVVDAHLVGRAVAETIRLRQLSDSTFEGLLIHRDRMILDANAAFCDMTGLSLAQVRQQPLARFVTTWADALDSPIRADGAKMREIMVTMGDGETFPAEVRSRDIDYDGSPARVTALRDIRERRAAEDRIRYLAHHDVLTGLANRFQLNDSATRAVAASLRSGEPLAVLCMDLDRFKSVNDTLGHDAGDLLLQQAADRIRETARNIDIAARVGGDEFVVLQTSLGQSSDAAQLARRLIDRLSEPYDINGQQVRVGASVGIAIHPRDGDQIDVLLKHADRALYSAKSKGRGDLCFFEAEMDTLYRERRALEQELAHAIRAGEMKLAFQPLFGTQSGDVVTLEALVRWANPSRGVIPPDKFIRLAEETNLIIPLGEWVLETACRAAMTWQSSCRVAVNVSARQFSGSDLPAMVASVLDRTGLPATRLELEVTESLVITNTEHALQALVALKRLGVHIVLDDFGTGYSTLSYLQRFPFDKIKIDKSFIDGLASDKDARAIVNAILEMSHQLNVNVTAEGVETSAQLALLRSGRCDEIQGFLLGRPIRSEKVKDYLSGVCSVVEAEEPDAQGPDSSELRTQEHALTRA